MFDETTQDAATDATQNASSRAERVTRLGEVNAEIEKAEAVAATLPGLRAEEKRLAESLGYVRAGEFEPAKRERAAPVDKATLVAKIAELAPHGGEKYVTATELESHFPGTNLSATLRSLAKDDKIACVRRAGKGGNLYREKAPEHQEQPPATEENSGVAETKAQDARARKEGRRRDR